MARDPSSHNLQDQDDSCMSKPNLGGLDEADVQSELGGTSCATEQFVKHDALNI